MFRRYASFGVLLVARGVAFDPDFFDDFLMALELRIRT